MSLRGIGCWWSLLYMGAEWGMSLWTWRSISLLNLFGEVYWWKWYRFHRGDSWDMEILCNGIGPQLYLNFQSMLFCHWFLLVLNIINLFAQLVFLKRFSSFYRVICDFHKLGWIPNVNYGVSYPNIWAIFLKNISYNFLKIWDIYFGHSTVSNGDVSLPLTLSCFIHLVLKSCVTSWRSLWFLAGIK